MKTISIAVSLENFMLHNILLKGPGFIMEPCDRMSKYHIRTLWALRVTRHRHIWLSALRVFGSPFTSSLKLGEARRANWGVQCWSSTENDLKLGRQESCLQLPWGSISKNFLWDINIHPKKVEYCFISAVNSGRRGQSITRTVCLFV